MCAPAGPPRLPVLLSATTALVLLAPPQGFATEAATDARQAIQAALPRYDPSAYEKARAEKEQPAAPKHTPAPLPEDKITAPAATAAAPASENILALPKVTVRSTERPIKRLPRIDPPAEPLKDLPGEPLESASGRDARMVKRHLNKLQQVLIPLFGGSVVAEAREAEARLQKAAQMNDLASSLELQEAAGRDPEEIKKLRAEYTKLYYSGPK
jgi:hypothetical protein